MTTAAVSTRRARGIHSKRAGLQQSLRENGSSLPEYLERTEIEAVIVAAPNPMAKLLMLEQWRAGLRVSDGSALEKRDLFWTLTGPRSGCAVARATRPVWCRCTRSCKPPSSRPRVTAPLARAGLSTCPGRQPGGGYRRSERPRSSIPSAAIRPSRDIMRLNCRLFSIGRSTGSCRTVGSRLDYSTGRCPVLGKSR